jgi:hypothetical protein
MNKKKLTRVPVNFEEALDILFKALEPDDIEYFKNYGSDNTHFGLALWCRNNWFLWEPKTELVEWFRNNLGLGHADDMSSILMESLSRKVNGKDIDLAGQVNFYRGHWATEGIDPLTLERVENKS